MKFGQRLFVLLLLCILVTAFVNSCSTIPNKGLSARKSKNTIERLRDSILQVGLDGEALYTILGTIKPMSSVVAFNFPVGNSDSTRKLDEHILRSNQQFRDLDTISQIQQAINSIDIPGLKFVMVPYKTAYAKSRILQVTVVRISALDSVLNSKKSFFGQYGFVPGTDPAVLLTVNEYEKRYERLRGYGYLFGYPDYAVDFFVRAFQQSDSTGNHVERKFFQIPTYGHATGSFVYAYPKDHVTSALDSTIYKRAQQVLKNYKSIRGAYLNRDSTLRAYDLIKDFYEAQHKK
ncbi:hypothetical protein [Sphingobacterium sp. BIGb0165]|uniref:hypothetical protein n=1 Tax=Sphingobacterium sp. BIGb0165 TaxID=2940615 RepID=UPI002167071B|nr:hypothetical protein [Sphingobacterium sp. BIGb0165]MCS4226480.1 hypothetical protein [Sphingobacterium sp. BIGb0165]